MTASLLGNTTSSGTNISTPITLAHSPGGSPQGVLITVEERPTAADNISGVTYGGVSIPEVTGFADDSPVLGTTAEGHAIHVFFLGSGVPSGDQDAVITPSAQGGRLCTVTTFSAAEDLEVEELELLVDTITASPSATLGLNGEECIVLAAWGSGRSAVGNISPLTDWSQEAEFDLGSSVAGLYSYDIVGTTDATVGYSASSDDVTLVGIAIKESAGGGVDPVPPLRRRKLMGY